MTSPTHRPTDAAVDNSGEADYTAKIQAVAAKLENWRGPIVLVAHVDPDGDALGSSLSLKRALDALGKATTLPLEPPRFLAFLAEPDELSAPLERLPENCLLVVLDVADEPRAQGAPLEGAAFTINLDHHGTNARYGDLACVEPGRAATAHIVKDVIDALSVAWTPEIATPCLTGILTDTGNLRFGNTTSETLRAVGNLIDQGVPYAELTDRLQWRHPDHFRMLGKVMSTAEFPLGGLVAMARITHAMREELGPTDDDSDDFVGFIRYAEGAQLAIFLKERTDEAGPKTKISVRAKEGVSAQAVCLAFGGGGHVAAAGATLHVGLEEARKQVLKVAAEELRAKGFEVPDA